MKYPAFKTANTHTLHIGDFTKGLSLNEATHENSDGALKECKNVWAENGLLKTRQGLVTNSNRLIADNRYGSGYYYTRSVTDVQIMAEGDTKRLVLEQVDLDLSHYVCFTHFVGSDGSIYKTADILFSRVSDDTFYIPNKINFFKGAPQNGSGIYAMVFAVNCENYTQTSYKIYELSEDLSQWERIYTPYIPTALINGRGNKYESAKSTNQAFTGTPARLEPLNILDPTFHAYFSTDGFSSAFRLPFAGLSSDRVVCRLYYTVESFVQWIIEENETSACATLYNVEVTMHINREKGIVSFTVPAGEYAVPLITDRNENNLRITATKKCDYSALDIANSNTFASFDSKILVGAKNRFYEANYSNPLYFPTDSSITLGSADSPITAIGKLDDEIMVFKGDEAYILEVTMGQRLSSTSLLAETDQEFSQTDKVKIKSVIETIGCNEQGSVISRKSSILCLGTDNRIYSITFSGKITPLTESLNIGKYSKTFGVAIENYNLFFSDNIAFAINCETGAIFNWEFPENLKFLGCYSQNSKPILLCRNTAGDLCFTCDLEGTVDTYLSKNAAEIVLDEADVETLIVTSPLSLGCDNTLKKLDKVILRLKGDADVKINDRFVAKIQSSRSDFQSVSLTLGLCNIHLLTLLVTSSAPISLGSADIKYTSLKL